MINCDKTNQGENWHCGVTKVSITSNMMQYEGHPVGIFYVIAEFASVQIIFGATVCVFYGHFSRKVPPPPTRNSEQSLKEDVPQVK